MNAKRIKTILSVDLGIKTGLALFSENANLLWFWSHNFGNRTRLKKGVNNILFKISKKWKLVLIVIEGSRDIGKIWKKKGIKLDVPVIDVSPERWRQDILGSRNLPTKNSKKLAALYARNIIIESGLSPPKLVNFDAAEAILIGLWGVKHFLHKVNQKEK